LEARRSLRRAAFELCDPLPNDASAEGYNGKKTHLVTPIFWQKRSKKGFDRSVTARSNCTLAFVFNKTRMGGGSLAEGTQAEGCKKIG
jgi:hypothetical protein